MNISDSNSKYMITDVIGYEREEDNYIEETDVDDVEMKIIAVYVTISEEYVSSLQFELSDLKRKVVLTALLGHKTNKEFCFGIDDGDSIRCIRVYYDNYFIHGIIFETTNGYNSPLYGSETLNKKIIVINNDKEELISFGGTYNNHITSVYFVKRKKDGMGKEKINDEEGEELPEEYKQMLLNAKF